MGPEQFPSSALLPGTPAPELPSDYKRGLHTGDSTFFPLSSFSSSSSWGSSCFLLILELKFCFGSLECLLCFEKHNYKLQGNPTCLLCSSSSLSSGSVHMNHVGSKAWKDPSRTLTASYPGLRESACITGLKPYFD